MRKKNKYCALGRLIAKRLIDMDQTQIWLSRETGIQQSSIVTYCNGKVIPSVYNIYKIAVALDFTTDTL
ncbi:MAG: helix-turn-helix transcriptional regulator, partial [Oscillospiraceae bacterium]|nr:helix-turn-helix transcriptional regulator [Oscillospiraceae bacterium]